MLRLLAVAMTIDALGSGLFGPFGLLYGHDVAGLSLARAGAALGVAGAAALACGPLAGTLVDRLGPARVVIVANAIAVAGGLLLLAARDAWTFTVASALSLGAGRMFWAAFAPLIGALTGDRTERWLGNLRSARLAGGMLGGFGASAVLLLGRHTGLIVLLAVDTATYALAALLTAVATRGTSFTVPAAEVPASYRVVLRDRALLGLTLLNVVCTLLVAAPVIAMPVYLIESAGGPAWLPGLTAGLLTGTVAVAMTRGPLLTRGIGRLRVLALAGLLWAAGCLIFIPARAAVVPVALGATLVLGLAQSLYEPTADTVALALAPAHLSGRYTAIYQLAWGVSGTIAPVLVGTLLATSPALLWVTLAALAGGAALAYRRAESRLGTRVGRVLT